MTTPYWERQASDGALIDDCGCAGEFTSFELSRRIAW